MPEFPTSGPVTVDVRLAGGNVELYAEPRETAQVEITPYDDSDASQEAAARTRVELTGDTLVIAAPEAGGWLLRRSPRLRVVARVPAGSSGRLKLATADATCHGEWTQVKLGTAAGDVYTEQVTGDLTVNTASGDVRAGQVGGRLTVKTASGDVSAQEVRGSVEVKSASGDVQIDDADGDLHITTASGNVTIGAARRGTLRANTVAGDISVGVVSGTGVWLDLNTLSGRATSDLSVTGGSGEASGPDLTVQVRAISGNIHVHRVNLPTRPAGQT
jgi:predicted DNA-binding protein with PD1-like motif